MRAQPEVSELPQTTGAQVPSLSDSPEDKNVPAGRPALGAAPKEPRSTRVSRAWNGVVPALVWTFILVFIFQNLHKTRVSFLVFSGTLPLAVALLAAAGFGGLFVLALGSIRMVQLRKVIRRSQAKNQHADLEGLEMNTAQADSVPLPKRRCGRCQFEFDGDPNLFFRTDPLALPALRGNPSPRPWTPPHPLSWSRQYADEAPH